MKKNKKKYSITDNYIFIIYIFYKEISTNTRISDTNVIVDTVFIFRLIYKKGFPPDPLPEKH